MADFVYSRCLCVIGQTIKTICITDKLTNRQTDRHIPHILHLSQRSEAAVLLAATTMETRHRVETTTKDGINCNKLVCTLRTTANSPHTMHTTLAELFKELNFMNCMDELWSAKIILKNFTDAHATITANGSGNLFVKRMVK